MEFWEELTPPERDLIERFRKLMFEAKLRRGITTDMQEAILWKGKVVPADHLTVTMWLHKYPDARTIGKDHVGGFEIVTSFIPVPVGWHRSFPDYSRPRYFETMVWCKSHEWNKQQYETLEEAQQGHAAMVAALRGPQ